MLKATMLALAAAATLGASTASAQVIDLGGRGGPSLDLRSDRQRERDYRREQARRQDDEDRYDRRGARGLRDGCREVTIRERDDYGRMVTRTRRDC